MKKALLALTLLATIGVANAQPLATGWSYGSFPDRMTDKIGHMAVLQSDERSSNGFNQVVLMCDAGSPNSAKAYLKTTRTYLGSDRIRYAYRVDGGEVINEVANNSVYNQAVSGDKKGVKVASGQGAIDFAKKLSNAKTMATQVSDFDGRTYGGNFDNVQQRTEKLQNWINACDVK